MAFSLPDLPYATAALEPHIDQRTMEIHHGKHHAAYVGNLNNALQSAGVDSEDLAGLLADNCAAAPESIRGAVRNNGGGHANHSLFWTVMTPDGGGAPEGELAAAIDRDLGGFESFQQQFTQAGITRFGSGWAWLVRKASGALEVYSTANQDSPAMGGDTPLLGLDVWEHAYYLNYQNRRPDYIAAWWEVVNWDEVARRFGG